MRKSMRTHSPAAVAAAACLTALLGLSTGADGQDKGADAPQSAAAAASSDGSPRSGFFRPVNLSLQPAGPEPESVYAPPAPPREEEGINEGAVHFDLAVGYFTDYVFRGIERFDEELGHEDRANLQISAKLSFDLGKLPHPFIATFVNVADSDPVNRFEEIRPLVGFDWTIRPLIISAGHNTYLFPDRKQIETSEVWGQLQLDDSYFFHTERPVISPYIYFAYDYDRYNGWYFEGGVSHTFVIEDTPLSIRTEASVSYVLGDDLFEIQPHQKDVRGFQHYQLGVIGNYSLNTLLNVSRRYGEWSVQGSVYYTDGLDNDLLSTTQIWGGAAIVFKY